MGYKIFTHEIRSSYAARIDNYRSYDIISKDIIQRWTYPYVPDVKFCGNRATKLERQGMYRASGNNLIKLLLIVAPIFPNLYLSVLQHCWLLLLFVNFSLYIFTSFCTKLKFD